MEKIKGIIESKSEKTGETNGKPWKRYALRIGGKTFSSFDIFLDKINEGDSVEIDYEIEGNFNNIRDIKLLDEITTADKVAVPQSVWEAKDRRIAREACLKAAAELLKALPPEELKEICRGEGIRSTCIDIAKTFERFVYQEGAYENPEKNDY